MAKQLYMAYHRGKLFVNNRGYDEYHRMKDLDFYHEEAITSNTIDEMVKAILPKNPRRVFPIIIDPSLKEYSLEIGKSMSKYFKRIPNVSSKLE